MPVVGGETVDDVGFIARLPDELVARRIADSARVYAVRSSRGGYMTYTLACAMFDRIAAAAAFIASMTEYQREDCRPGRAVPLMVVAGTADPTNRYEGGRGPRGRLLSVPDTLEFWRDVHGCTGRTVKGLPHRDGSDPTRVTLIQWTGCRTPGALRLYRVEGGGHHMPALTAAGAERFGRRNGGSTRPRRRGPSSATSRAETP